MTSFYGICPASKYNQSFTGAKNNTDHANVSTEDTKRSEKLSDIPTDKVGTTSSKVARKGVKHLWHKFTNYLSEHFQKKTPEENQGPKYDYQA